MRRLLILFTILCFTLGSYAQKKEKLIICGCAWNKIQIIDKASNNVEWTYVLKADDDCNDIEITKEGNILFAYKGGARLVDREKNLLWDFHVNGKEELYTATQRKNGDYMLAICGNPSRIVTLDKTGKKIEELNFNTRNTNIHSQFRQIIQYKKGYLIPLMGEGVLAEFDENGERINTIKVGGNPFSVKLIGPKTAIVTCGDAHKMVEIDLKTWTIIKEVTNNEIEGGKLRFAAEPIHYKNGNTLIANWSGHSTDKKQANIIEIDSTNKVVWTYFAKEWSEVSAVYSFFSK